MQLRRAQKYSYTEFDDPMTGETHEYAGVVVASDAALWVECQSAETIARKQRVREFENSEHLQAGATGAKRGKIVTFTRQSQKNMMTSLSSWDVRTRLAFVTLTYPKHFPDPYTAQTEHRDKFLALLRKHWPEVCGPWRLEYQMRGAPHYHFVFDGIDGEAELVLFRQWVFETWASVRGAEYCHSDLSLERQEVAWANNDRLARFYLTKELGKSIQSKGSWANHLDGLAHYGRFWGWVNQSKMKSVYSEYRFPRVLAERVTDAIQFRVFEKMQADGKIEQRPDGTYVMRKSGKPVARYKLQRWLIVDSGFQFLKSIMDALDWSYLCDLYGWEARPPLEFFETPPD